jgi:AcrR family transcriptional regulator
MASMGRWVEGSQGRLHQAALELYNERGFEQTTVADIAERAGVTERTFFRYYADKREVLFGGSSELQDHVVASVAQADARLEPIEIACNALADGGEFFVRDYSRKRAAAIAANPSLQERERLKRATLAGAVTAALRARGGPDAAPAVAGESAITVFKIAFERWVTDPPTGDFRQNMTAVLGELRALTGH